MMKAWIRHIAAGWILTILCIGSARATNVSGILSTNATWSSSGNPYIVTSNFTVSSNVLLTVAPNTVVQIDSNAVFNVQGTIQAVGGWSSSVIFTNRPSQSFGGMLNLTGIPGSSSATGLFSYCRFFNLYGVVAAMSPTNSYFEMTHCRIENIGGKFLHPTDSRLVIALNVFHDTGEAINAGSCAGVIASNHISKINGDSDGIDLDLVWTGPGDNSMMVVGNVLSDATHFNADAIDLGTSPGSVVGNFIRNFGDKGISVGEGSSADIWNNVVFACAMGMAIKDGSDPRVANNTFVGCTYGVNSYPKYTTEGGHGSITNMIIWNCATSILLQGNSTLSVGSSIIGGASVWPGTGNTTNNPQLVDLVTGRLRLMPTSPARNAGATLSWMSTNSDAVGHPRIGEGTPDRGAYEFTLAPELELEYPNGREIITNGDIVQVRWMAYGTNWPAGTTVALDVSPDEGGTWLAVTSGISVTPYVAAQVPWNTANMPASGDCLFRLTATNGVTDESDVAFTLLPLTIDHFTWDAIPSPQNLNVSFPVKVTAQAANGYIAAGFSGSASLWATMGGGSSNVVIGTGTNLWDYPLSSYYHDARTQVIYLTNEIGGAMQITGLTLDVTTPPSQGLTNWTIRLGYTALASYPVSTPVWVNSGWTTVYQANQSPGTTGLVTFVFSTPFSYNGLSNLMVDFSFNNTSFTWSGTNRATVTGTRRTLYYRTDSGFGDPLAWSGPSNPTPSVYLGYPNIHLLSSSGGSVTIAPTQTAAFVNGAWSGRVSVMSAATNVQLHASDGQGHVGQSGSFNTLLMPVVVVSSEVPGVMPPVGTNSYAIGSTVACYVTTASYEVPMATQYLGNGWVGSGNVPASGPGTNTGFFIVTTNSSVTWSWSADRVYVSVATQGNGTVDLTGAWLSPVSNFTATATPGLYQALTSWGGATNGCVMTTGQISGTVQMARAITAAFGDALATNATPVWWLNQYYPGTGNVDAAALSDSDGDGMTAWEEWGAGTDPTNAASLFKVMNVVWSNGSPTLVWSSVSNRMYFVRYITNLLTDAGYTVTSTIASGANSALPLQAPARMGYYEVGITNP